MSDWLLDALLKHAAVVPTKPLGVFRDQSISYEQVAELLEDESQAQLAEGKLNPILSALVTFLHNRKKWSELSRQFCSDADIHCDTQVQSFVAANPGQFVTSSGSTGIAKTIYVTFAAQEVTARSININIIRNRDLDEVLILPFHYSSGAGRVRAAILRGATIYFAGTPVRPRLLVEIGRNSGNFATALTPSSWRYLKSSMGAKSWDFLKLSRSTEFGSAPLAQREIDELRNAVGTTGRLFMHYGLTEASRSFVRDLTEVPIEGALGDPMPHVQFRLRAVNDEQGAELEIAGTHTASLVHRQDVGWQFIGEANPWLSTGDLVGTDAEGELRLTGRLDDLCDVGGKLVSPAKIESALHARDVGQECIVISRRHPILGNELICVTGQGGAEGVRLRLRELRDQLEPYEMPTDVVELQELPYLDSMKLDRLAIRQLVDRD